MLADVEALVDTVVVADDVTVDVAVEVTVVETVLVGVVSPQLLNVPSK